MNTAFAGERGAFTELAAYEYFGKAIQLLQVGLFDDVFSAVSEGRATYGIVPIENTRAGSVHNNYDLLLEHNCSIVGELYLKIAQYLIVNKETSVRHVKRVLSHPQALAQCRHYLSEHQNLKTEETVNTAVAVKMIKEKKLMDAAAIASMQAAIDFDMKVIAENIQDDKNNMTRFLILQKEDTAQRKGSKQMKTSIVFSMKNIPGALFKCLATFSLRDIDLYKIESRPMFGQGFQYMFYLDFAGSDEDIAQKNALTHLQEMTTVYRCLGSYPVGKSVIPKHVKRSIL